MANFIKIPTFTQLKVALKSTKKYIDDNIPTKVSELQNDSGYITNSYGIDKNGISTEAIGTASVAIGGGVKSYGKYSLGIGCLSNTGIPDEIKQQYIANYLNTGVESTVRVYIADTYYDMKLKNPDYTGGLPEFTPTGENGTYLPSDIDLSLMVDDYSNYFILFGNNSFVNGWESGAVGQSSVANGNYNAAFGHSSVATGYANKAYSIGAVALGITNEAGYWNDPYAGHIEYTEGSGAVALGRSNKAYGTTSVALGKENKVIGESSVALGQGLIVTNDNGVAVGKYNDNTSSGLFNIGIGNDISDRKNAMVVTQDYSLFETVPVVNTQSFKTNPSQVDSSGMVEIKIADDAVIHENGGRLIVDFPVKEMPVLNRFDRCLFTFTIEGTSYSIECVAVEFWSIKYRETEGKGLLPSIGFKSNDSNDNTNLLKLAGLNNGNTTGLNLKCYAKEYANVFDKYAQPTATRQTLVGNAGTGDSSTVFAVGNGLVYAESGSGTQYNESKNAFEVKYNGDVIVEGNIRGSNGTTNFNGNISITKNEDDPISNVNIYDTVIVGKGTSSKAVTVDATNFKIKSSGGINLDNTSGDSKIYLKSSAGIIAGIGTTKNIEITGDTESNETYIRNLVSPTNDTDAANKKYVDDSIPTDYLSTIIGDTQTVETYGSGKLYIVTSRGGQLIIGGDADTVYMTGLKAPTSDSDAANKAYVDSAIASAITETLSTAV